MLNLVQVASVSLYTTVAKLEAAFLWKKSTPVFIMEVRAACCVSYLGTFTSSQSKRKPWWRQVPLTAPIVTTVTAPHLCPQFWKAFCVRQMVSQTIKLVIANLLKLNSSKKCSVCQIFFVTYKTITSFNLGSKLFNILLINFQVVNIVTSNQDCVNNIAESMVLSNLLALLHSLPSSRYMHRWNFGIHSIIVHRAQQITVDTKLETYHSCWVFEYLK